jgi:6-pyruvoyltetrahydropterin/6-carboxytetrahydropterin synthase
LPHFIQRKVEFDAGHRVPNHESKCRNPHGHRYKVLATITGQLVDRSGASDQGMVLDFGEISTLLKEKVHDVYDHGFIVYEKDDALLDVFGMRDTPNHEPPFGWKIIEVGWIPTAENMARAIFEDLWNHVMDMDPNGRVTLYSIEVYETPKSKASYVGGI